MTHTPASASYRSSDGGATWTHSAGIPDGLLGFRIVVDPNDASRVYAATGGGLNRSTDAGATFANVNHLPTGDSAPAGTPNCNRQPPTAKDCFLANMVTDVVVQGPANAQTPGGKPGAVMAAVGWRAGNKPNADGSQRRLATASTSPTPAPPGTFQNMNIAANSTPTTDPLTQARIGRMALGIASGPGQDHRIVYALIQDAVKFNGGALGLDAAEPTPARPAYSDYLNGIWVSKDFGASWKQLEGRRRSTTTRRAGRPLRRPPARPPSSSPTAPESRPGTTSGSRPTRRGDARRRADPGRDGPRGGLGQRPGYRAAHRPSTGPCRPASRWSAATTRAPRARS